MYYLICNETRRAKGVFFKAERFINGANYQNLTTLLNNELINCQF